MLTGSNGHVDIGKLPIEKRAPALQKMLGLKQTDFAALVGVNVRQVKRWTAGAVPSEESAHELARVAPKKLKARPEWFFIPRERREERVAALEQRVDKLERRLRKAGL